MTRDDKVRVILSKRAARAYQDGENRRWPACIAARMITTNHRYQHDGARAEFADALAIGQSQVDNLSLAGSVYGTLRSWVGQSGAALDIRAELLHEIRRCLSVSHFSRMGRLCLKYDWGEHGPLLMLKYLYRAMTSEPRLSVDRMTMLVEAEESQRGNKQPAGDGNLDKLDSRSMLAREQRKHAQLAGARPARVLAVDEDSDGLRVTLATERRGGVRVGQEALVVFVNGDE